jgi:hypothetical protein
MRINGEWFLCDDGAIRPILRGEIEAGDGSWVETSFLVDPGADRTVFSADILRRLGLQPLPSPHQLGGVGGLVPSVCVDTRIAFPHEDGGTAVFRGQFAAFTDPAALDMSALGRDLTSLFAVIIDRPGNTVCLVGQNHYYTISRK